ncbi:MAG: class I SAM-dependent methyltransferase, partial [Pseudomonadota bacterium]
GAGDGRIVIEAARRGIPAHGIELDPELVALARKRAAEAQVADLATFAVGDVFDADLSGATVVTLYLMPDANLALRPKLLAELQPGTRVLSLSFTMGEWQPDARAQGRTSGGVLLWQVPARVAGHWELLVDDRRYDLIIAQDFQKLEAALSSENGPLKAAAHLRGSELTILFEEAGQAYRLAGTVADKAINASNSASVAAGWSARRKDEVADERPDSMP